MLRSLPLGGAALLLASSASANVHALDAWSVRVGANATVTAQIQGVPGAPFALFSTDLGDPFVSPSRQFLARGVFPVSGTTSVVLPLPANLPSNMTVNMHLATRDSGVLDVQTQALALEGRGSLLCEEYDPNYANGDYAPATGETLASQWALAGMTVSGSNNVPSHPQSPILFDSANPTGGDGDLATPGYGPGNTEAYGKLIIVPENDGDGDGDGNVDVPDDEEFGGTIAFDFADPYRMCSATLVDIDDSAPSELRFYIGDTMALETIPVAFQGDNGVQTLTFDKADVRRFEVVLGGSGAIARLQMVPCPIVVNFDENAFGKPLDLQTGEEITNQISYLGMTVSATNNNPAHPNKAILFDSENPTGGDDDLITPGFGVNNTEALGHVLILAENDIDANGDGYVDDPDDEEAGGQIIFDFIEPVTFFSTKVLDVDAMERDVFLFYDANGTLLDTLEIDSLGENSVQTLMLTTPLSGVSQIVVNFTGSGAFTRLRYCPDSNHGGNAAFN